MFAPTTGHAMPLQRRGTAEYATQAVKWSSKTTKCARSPTRPFEVCLGNKSPKSPSPARRRRPNATFSVSCRVLSLLFCTCANTTKSGLTSANPSCATSESANRPLTSILAQTKTRRPMSAQRLNASVSLIECCVVKLALLISPNSSRKLFTARQALTAPSFQGKGKSAPSRNRG